MEIPSSTFTKNIKYLRAKRKVSQEEFSVLLNIKRSVYKRLELGSEPSPAMIVMIADFYHVSTDELLRIDIETADKQQIKAKSESLMESANLRVLAISVDSDDREYIQYVPEKAKAGYLTGYANPAYIGALPTFRLPYLPVGSYRAFEIKGDSMPPVGNGAMVIGKYLEHLNQLRSLSTYILVTKDDGIVYKRLIYKDKQKKLICISDNPQYPPYTMPIENVVEIWDYYCHINFDGNDRSHNYMLQEMLKLGEEVEDLEKIVKGR